MRKFALSAVTRLAPRQAAATRLRRAFGFNRVKDFIVKAWKDTYPDEDDTKTRSQVKMDQKRKKAAEERESREKYESLTEEELEEVRLDLHQLEKHIPEERRRAIVIVNKPEASETLSKRIKRRVWNFLKESAVAEELKKQGVSLEEFNEVAGE